MDSKKDPGKFTVRFNLADPQQRRAAELLNRQGRFKAQFIANAVLHYTGGQPQGSPAVDSEQLRLLVESILAQRETRAGEASIDPVSNRDEQATNITDRNAIFRTLEAFQQQKIMSL